jgi:kynurenine 3-monooxygenase
MQALSLAQRGYNVHLFERRPDFRIEALQEELASHETSFLGHSTSTTKRSINLALSHRGQEALRAVGLLEAVMAETVPMKERAMHMPGGMHFQPYGKGGQAIYSISRTFINRVLLDALEQLPNVTVKFEAKLAGISADNVITLQRDDGSREELQASVVFGCDGAYSAVRGAMLRMSRTSFSRHYIDHGYKELTIPAGEDGDFQLQPVNALHIWPRHEFMMIALPNPDKSFTCTMFAPYDTFSSLETPEEIRGFFMKHFPDAVPKLPFLAQQFKANPTGALVTVKCNPWQFKGKICLMGDAAHAIVPFYGQGMNAGFEDVLSFGEVLDKCKDLTQAIHLWAHARRPAGDGIADLSYYNYVEMRSHTASPLFLLQKRVEGWLNALFPRHWIPLYSMVAFTRIPYHEAWARGKRQDAILRRIVLSAGTVGAVVAAAALYTCAKRGGARGLVKELLHAVGLASA